MWKAINVCALGPTSGWLGENWGGVTAGLRDALPSVSLAGTYQDTGVPRCHLPPLISINEINVASRALNCHVSVCVCTSLFVKALTNCFAVFSVCLGFRLPGTVVEGFPASPHTLSIADDYQQLAKAWKSSRCGLCLGRGRVPSEICCGGYEPGAFSRRR